MSARPRPIRLYESTIASGNAYKVWLLMVQLGIACERVKLDILATPWPDEIALWQERGQAALHVMDRHLHRRDFFVADRYTIADVALYAYTHTAGAAGFDLDAVPAVGRWLARVAAQPGHVAIENGPGSPGFAGAPA